VPRAQSEAVIHRAGCFWPVIAGKGSRVRKTRYGQGFRPWLPLPSPAKPAHARVAFGESAIFIFAGESSTSVIGRRPPFLATSAGKFGLLEGWASRLAGEIRNAIRSVSPDIQREHYFLAESSQGRSNLGKGPA